jgi:hypothetical protein
MAKTARSGQCVGPDEVLIDAPPVTLEVDIAIDVVHGDGTVHQLGEVSPVVHALAKHQFDDQVKRIRVLVAPKVRDELGGSIPVDWIASAIEQTDTR